jgi:hypothetical protein
MGDNPKSSVVDKYCRIHDVDNLYVMDGSVHVTNGGFNPVLTIMALAYYASDHLVKTWNGKHGASDETPMTAGGKSRQWRFSVVLFLLLVALVVLPGASIYYRYSGGRSCARCHEIWQPYTDWHTSTHRNLACSDRPRLLLTTPAIPWRYDFFRCCNGPHSCRSI